MFLCRPRTNLFQCQPQILDGVLLLLMLQVRSIRAREMGCSCCYSRCRCLPILPDSKVAEAMAMLKGFEFARDCLFFSLQAESDSINVIEVSQTNNMSNPTWIQLQRNAPSYSLVLLMLGLWQIKPLIIYLNLL